MSVSRMTAVCPAAPEPALLLHQLGKAYGRQQVLSGISLAVAKGEIFGLLGPNGAGKTTLMKLIAGLSRPDSGRLAIFGRDGGGERAGIKQLIALVAQESNLEREFTVREALLTYARLFGIADPARRVEEVSRQFDLYGLRDKKVAVLSGGMARRLLIARALLPEPRLLLLDEPTVGLDPDVRQDIWNIVRQLAADSVTIFMTTHYMEEAEQLCHRVALLKDGRVMTVDTPDGIKSLAAAPSAAMTLESAFLRLIRGESS
ncbi:MAG TPA: ABC transporter ATP-binding protein [Selenomonadales bacterium]|nr:ABC transporter ATP-binding protein [Selenomonadales bacterium]